jgi:2-polyprenyl-3-methyl-5-hydroxy-6-metoxy-1,4-benzoquinol methylase
VFAAQQVSKRIRELTSGPIADLLLEHAENPWFLRTYWPENESRVLRMVEDVDAVFPIGSRARVLDVGCFNGFLSYLFARLGYRVTASDMWDSPERTALLAKVGADFRKENFNHLDVFGEVSEGSFEVAIMGEVIEHILNHPLGLLKSVARLLTPKGLLILTTPNPSTLMNAARVLLDKHTLWGTQAFYEQPKVDGDAVISQADIHYREYLTREVRHLVESAGFAVQSVRYMPMGPAEGQSRGKRLLKSAPVVRQLFHTRLLATTQYVVASRA